MTRHIREIVEYNCDYCNERHKAYKGIPNQCPSCRKKIRYPGPKYMVHNLKRYQLRTEEEATQDSDLADDRELTSSDVKDRKEPKITTRIKPEDDPFPWA